MAVAFMCDRCKTIFEDKKNMRKVVCGEITASTTKLINKNTLSVDLCKKCCDELFNFEIKESEEK